MGSLKKAFGFLLRPTSSRIYSILAFLIILALIPLTVLFAQMHQGINQEAAVKNIPTPSPNKTVPNQTQNPTAFAYIEPFTIDGIEKTDSSYNPKDKNITFYLYNLTDDPENDPKETKVFKKITIPATYDKVTNTFSSSRINLENVPVGSYQLLIKIDGSLRQSLGTKDISSSSKTIIIQGKEIELIMGDINKDNEINILDYTMISNCFEEKAVTSLCEDIDPSDLNYDGLINSLDYDLLLKSLLVSKTKKL